MTPADQAVIGILEKFENGSVGSLSMVNPTGVYKRIQCRPIQLLGFSCLATYSGREELIPEINQTYFFRNSKYVNRIERLRADLLRTGIDLEVEIILPDTEPIRTWGWGTDQEELTYYCECMRDDFQLSDGWKVTIWSEIEAQLEKPIDFSTWVVWAGSKPLLISQVVAHLRQFKSIKFPKGVEWSALRQVAAYAMEGFVLEQLRSESILAQSEKPYDRKDRMYQLCRNTPLPIIHPFI
ncbi:MAG: hypothetical protein ABIA47_00340 [bacterium]